MLYPVKIEFKDYPSGSWQDWSEYVNTPPVISKKVESENEGEAGLIVFDDAEVSFRYEFGSPVYDAFSVDLSAKQRYLFRISAPKSDKTFVQLFEGIADFSTLNWNEFENVISFNLVDKLSALNLLQGELTRVLDTLNARVLAQYPDADGLEFKVDNNYPNEIWIEAAFGNSSSYYTSGFSTPIIFAGEIIRDPYSMQGSAPSPVTFALVTESWIDAGLRNRIKYIKVDGFEYTNWINETTYYRYPVWFSGGGIEYGQKEIYGIDILNYNAGVPQSINGFSLIEVLISKAWSGINFIYRGISAYNIPLSYYILFLDENPLGKTPLDALKMIADSMKCYIFFDRTGSNLIVQSKSSLATGGTTRSIGSTKIVSGPEKKYFWDKLVDGVTINVKSWAVDDLTGENLIGVAELTKQPTGFSALQKIKPKNSIKRDLLVGDPAVDTQTELDSYAATEALSMLNFYGLRHSSFNINLNLDDNTINWELIDNLTINTFTTFFTKMEIDLGTRSISLEAVEITGHDYDFRQLVFGSAESSGSSIISSSTSGGGSYYSGITPIFNLPLEMSGGIVSLLNTDNLKITSNQLDTVQPIKTTDTPTFNQILLSAAATLSNHAVRADRIINTSYPLTGGGNLTSDRTIGLSYNATNLKLTSNALNTIQDIATVSSPTFNLPNFTGGLKINGSTLSDASRNLTTGNITANGNLSVSKDIVGVIKEKGQVKTTTHTQTPSLQEIVTATGVYTNKLRFVSPIEQEESTDGINWTPSSRLSTDQLGDIMIGGGQQTSYTIIPITAVGQSSYYRLTWGATYNTRLEYLYMYMNTVPMNVLIERYQSSTDTWYVVASGTTGYLQPGHFSLQHQTTYYHPTATGWSSKVRITFSVVNATAVYNNQIGNIEWFGQYPADRKTVEYYDRYKSAYFPKNLCTVEKLGVGTTTPIAALDLKQGGLRVNGGSYAGSGLSLHYDLANGGYIQTYNSKPLILNALDNNIGIGTTAPSEKLDVNGNIKALTGKFTNLTDGYLPYHVSDAVGLSNSNIFTNGTNVGIGGTTLTEKLNLNGNAKIWGDIYSDNFNGVDPYQGYYIGRSGSVFSKLTATEMHVKSFIADLEQALAGSQIIAKSVAKVYETFDPSYNTRLIVESFEGYLTMAVFANGDTIRLRNMSRVSGGLTVTDTWISVTLDTTYGVNGFDSITKTQAYTFAVIGGSAIANKGSLAIDYGVLGNGIIETIAVGAISGKPYQQIAEWTSGVIPVMTIRERHGHLGGVTSTNWGALNNYGFYSSYAYLENNVYIAGNLWALTGGFGGTVTSPVVSVANYGLTINNAGSEQALAANSIMIGNITGTANSGLKLSKTSSNNTSGLFGYDASANELFALRLDGTAQISGFAYDNTKINKIFSDGTYDYELSLRAGADKGYYLHIDTSAVNIPQMLSVGSYRDYAGNAVSGYGIRYDDGGDVLFQLGTTGHKISSWTFDAAKLYTGSFYLGGSSIEYLSDYSTAQSIVMGQYDSTSQRLVIRGTTTTSFVQTGYNSAGVFFQLVKAGSALINFTEADQTISSWHFDIDKFIDGNVRLEASASLKGLGVSDGADDVIKIGDFTGTPNPAGIDNTSALLGTTGTFDAVGDFSSWTQVVGGTGVSWIRDTTTYQAGTACASFPGYIGSSAGIETRLYKTISISAYAGQTIEVSAYIMRGTNPAPLANEQVNFIVSFNTGRSFGGYYPYTSIGTTWGSMGPAALKTLTVQVPTNATTMTITFVVTSSVNQSSCAKYYFDTVKIKTYNKVFIWGNTTGLYAKASPNNYFQFTNGVLQMDAAQVKVGGQSLTRWRGSNLTTDPIEDMREGDMWHRSSGAVYIWTANGGIQIG